MGERLRAIRERDHARQDDMAFWARMVGLPWTRDTVAALQTGGRELSLHEFFLLRGFDATNQELDHLFGRTSPTVTRVEGATLGSTAQLLRLVSAWVARLPALRVGRRMSTGATVRVTAEALLDAERKASRRLKVKPAELVAMAYRLWGRTLSEERDHRVQVRAGSGDASALRAHRGHVTRALVEELRNALHANRRRKEPHTS